MKPASAVLVRIFCLATLIVFSFGCRTPKISKEQRGLPPTANVPTAPELGFDPVGPGSWGTLDEPLEGALGTDGLPANERRWEGVAVYFGYNRATIGVSEQHKVESLGKHLLNNSNYYVIIEGHCDERGSDEYNRALGERRALAVHDYLVTLGVDANRIRTISYGEERPAVPDATTEEQHAKNRRAEFIIGVGQ